MRNAMTLGQYPSMKGSSAMTGVRQIRASVRMLGRVQRMSPPLAQRLQDQLAHRLQGVEHAVAADRHGLEVGRPANPLIVDPLDQVLARMHRIGGDLLLLPVFYVLVRVEGALEIADRRGIRLVAFVVLDD